jgi:hypothetical protein
MLLTTETSLYETGYGLLAIQLFGTWYNGVHHIDL